MYTLGVHPCEGILTPHVQSQNLPSALRCLLVFCSTICAQRHHHYHAAWRTRLLLDFLLPSASYWQSTPLPPQPVSLQEVYFLLHSHLHIKLSWYHRQLDFMMESSLTPGRITFMICLWQARLLHLCHPWPHPHPMATTAFNYRVKKQASCTSSVWAHYPPPSNHLYFCHFI